MTVFQGSCLCSKILFEIAAPTKWCGHCHCNMCQSAHGAGFVTWVGVPTEGFHLLRGEDQLIWYNSSEAAQRGFCRCCGSTMLFRSERWAGEVHVARACIPGPIDKQPAGHAFFDQHVDWLAFDDGLKRLGGESGTEPLDA